MTTTTIQKDPVTTTSDDAATQAEAEQATPQPIESLEDLLAGALEAHAERTAERRRREEKKREQQAAAEVARREQAAENLRDYFARTFGFTPTIQPDDLIDERRYEVVPGLEVELGSMVGVAEPVLSTVSLPGGIRFIHTLADLGEALLALQAEQRLHDQRATTRQQRANLVDEQQRQAIEGREPAPPPGQAIHAAAASNGDGLHLQPAGTHGLNLFPYNAHLQQHTLLAFNLGEAEVTALADAVGEEAGMVPQSRRLGFIAVRGEVLSWFGAPPADYDGNAIGLGMVLHQRWGAVDYHHLEKALQAWLGYRARHAAWAAELRAVEDALRELNAGDDYGTAF